MVDLPAEEIGGGSGGGGGGSSGGPLISTAVPVNGERGLHQPEVGTVAGARVHLPEAAIDAAAPASTADPTAVAAGAAAAPAATTSAGPAASPPVQAGTTHGGTGRDGDSSLDGGGGSAAGAAGVGGLLSTALMYRTAKEISARLPADEFLAASNTTYGTALEISTCRSVDELPVEGTSGYTTAEAMSLCLSAEQLCGEGDLEGQGPVLAHIERKSKTTSQVSNGTSAAGETGVVPLPRKGCARGVDGGGNDIVSEVVAGAMVSAFQETSTVARKTGEIAPGPVDGGGASRQVPCGGPQKLAQSVDWGTRKEIEWRPRAMHAGNSVVPPQTKIETAGSGGASCVHYVAPTRVGEKEYQTLPRRQQGANGVRSPESSGYPQPFQQSNLRSDQFPSPYSYEAGVAAGGAVYWPAPASGGVLGCPSNTQRPGNDGMDTPGFPCQVLPEVRGGTVFYPDPALAATGSGWDCVMHPGTEYPYVHAAAPGVNADQDCCYYGPPPPTTLYQGCTAAAIGPGHAVPLAAPNTGYPTSSEPGRGGGFDPLWERAGEPPCGAVFVEGQTFASTSTPGVHENSVIACGEQASVSPQPWKECNGVATQQPTPETHAPPFLQPPPDWADADVFPRCCDVMPTRGGAGGGLSGGYRAITGRVGSVPATREQAQQLAGAYQTGAAPHGSSYIHGSLYAHGSSYAHESFYGGPVSHDYSPYDGYNEWTATPQQWPSVACGPAGYTPETVASPGQELYAY